MPVEKRRQTDVSLKTQMFTKMTRTKLDAFGVQDCGLTGDSVRGPAFLLTMQVDQREC